MTSTRIPASHFALVLAICLAWGGNFLASSIALKQIPPFLFTALRLVIVLLALLPWLKPVPEGQRLRLVVVALCSGALHFGLNFWALRSAAHIAGVAIALQTYIPMSALFAWWLLGERIGIRTGLGIALAFGGVLILGFDPSALEAPQAIVITVVSAVVLALGTTLMRGLSGIHTFQLQAWAALIGIPVLLAISAVLEPGAWSTLPGAEWKHWAGVVYSGLLASVVGHGLLFWLLQRHPVAQITPYLLLAPVFAIVLGIVFWGDRPGTKLWIGGAMVLSGVFVVATRALVRGRTVVAEPSE